MNRDVGFSERSVRWRAVVVACAVAAATTVVSFWFVLQTVEGSSRQQVHQAESLVARERGDQLATSLRRLVERVDGAARVPGLARLVADGGNDALAEPLEVAALSAGARTVAIRDADGELLASHPVGETMPEADPVGIAVRPFEDRDDALVRITRPVADSVGKAVGSITIEVALSTLAPGFTTAPDLDSAIVTLVDRRGHVLATGSPTPFDRLQAPEVLAAVDAAEPAVVSYHAAALDADRLGAVAPVPGTDWMVVLGADPSIAYAPARALTVKLAMLFGATLVAVGSSLGMAFELVRRNRHHLEDAHREAESLALTDPLTGAGNRRRLDSLLGDETIATFGLVTVDLDDFKTLNDTHGHAAGDAGLRDVVGAIHRVIRDHDSVIRLGGDEFLVVQRNGDAGSARACARRIQEAVTLEVSVGWAGGPRSERDELLRSADWRLYEDKQKRSRATAASRTGEPIRVVGA